MNVPLRWSLLALTALGVVAYLLFFGTTGQRVTTSFSSYDEAVQRSAGRPGRVPPWLPRTATRILEVRDVESGRQWVRFSASAAELRRAVATMDGLPLAEAVETSVRPPRAMRDWPPELSTPNATPRSASQFGLFRYPREVEGARCLAVDWRTLTGYAWSC